MSTPDATPRHWLWLQHRDMPPGVALSFRDDLLTTAFARGHGTVDVPGSRTYAFAVGRDVETGGGQAWFLARPDWDDDGNIRYWVEYGVGAGIVRESRALDSDGAHDAFRSFLDALD